MGTRPSRPWDSLLPSESNALLAALVCVIAARNTIRLLVIKGVTLEALGLRPPRTSSDVDVLVDPADASPLVSILESLGWHERESTVGSDLHARHGVTLVHNEWPTDLDIHFEFPGMLAGAQRSFDVLWSGRAPLPMAGQVAWVPDRESSIVIWALHSLRGRQAQARHAEDLERLIASVLPSLPGADLQELADRALELGADAPLRVVPEFAEIIGDRQGPQASSTLEAWLAEVAQTHELSPWFQILRNAPRPARPQLLARAMWPSAHDLRLTDELLVDTPWGRVQSRGRRVWRLVRRVVERRRQAH